MSQPTIETLRTTMELAYTWDYTSQVRSLRDLYTKSKDLQWDGAKDLPWHLDVDPEGPRFPDAVVPIYGSDIWHRMTVAEQKRTKVEVSSWMLSQFLHGEQGALLATSQLVTCVTTPDAKLYAATQVMDEARHVEVYERYLREKMNLTYPVTPTLKSLLDVILTDGRWDMKYLGMQIMVEGLALAAFGVIRATTDEPLIRELTAAVIRDEARHVAFGVLSLDNVFREMPANELRDREDFVIESSRLMRDRFLAPEVWAKMGLPVEECCAYALECPLMQQFRCMLFSKIVPNLKRLGLLTDRVRPALQALGVLEFEHVDPDLELSLLSEAPPAFADAAE
jgi:hypothetical protein